MNNLFAEIVIHHGDEQDHEPGAGPSHLWGPAIAPSREHEQHRTMERCLSLFHLQGFSLTCFTWVYVFTDEPLSASWAQGGPTTVIYSGIIAIFGTALVTLSLAEVASACPSIGGLYYYSARLSPQAYKGVAGFMTAHCNVIGVLTSIPYCTMQLANLMSNIRYALTYNDVTGIGQLTSNLELFYIYTGIILAFGLLASVPSRVISFYCTFALFLSLITFFSLSVTILILAPSYNTARFVFQDWQDHSADTGINSRGLSFLVACNMAVSTFSGWDTVIYMTEEVLQPTYAMPAAMLTGFTGVAMFASTSVVILLYSIQDPAQLSSSTAVFGSTSAVSQALWDLTQARFGSGSASVVFMTLIGMSIFLMILFLFIGTSRKLYAMSRDRMWLGSSLWSVLHPTLLIPLRCVWAMVAAEICLGSMLLADSTGQWFWNLSAQSMPLTLSSYLLPILICLGTKERLQPGPWNMGTWGPMVRTGAVAYLLLTLIIVTLPSSLPVTTAAPPYQPIMAVACVLFMQVCWWLPVIGGRHFYFGPGDTGVGRVRIAISSPVLTPMPRRFRFSKAAAVVPVRHDFHNLAEAASLGPVAGAKLADTMEQPGFKSQWEQLRGSWGWLNPRSWFAPAVKSASHDYDLDSCRPSPNNFYRQPTLRIPGEKEALSRAQKSPTHLTGYAWDKEAAKRLGHQDHKLDSQRSFHQR